MFYSVMTTIQQPTDCVKALAKKLAGQGGRLIVAGDKKGPANFDSTQSPWPVEFMSLNDQNAAGLSITEKLPTGHYARKNVAYLHAMRSGATCIYETDDDNAPNENWQVRDENVSDARRVQVSANEWVNVYKYFSNENIWPRGLPLDEIQKPVADIDESSDAIRAPIQQGLVNGSPDVDAIWRLVMDRPFNFEDNKSVYLPPGAWCPFNTQSTWWWPIAYPLMYIPSYCSFRMCDIWKSFVAQRCLWELDMGVVFHAPEVDQDRNEHDLQKDFDDELPGYTNNRRIAEILDKASLGPGEDLSGNLLKCYETLVKHQIFPNEELNLVRRWVGDIESVT